MYSSTVKSLRRQGMFTWEAISFKYSSLPRNHFGSVRTEMQSAPAASYSRAIARYGKSGAIRPLDGDAFLHSQMKERSGVRRAHSKEKSPFGRAKARARISSAGMIFFASAVRSMAWAASWSKMFINSLLVLENSK